MRLRVALPITAGFLLLVFGPAPVPAGGQPSPPPAAADSFRDKVLPFFRAYCLSCHSGDNAKGGLALDVYMSEAHARKDRKNWLAVQHVLATAEMPPKNKPQPTAAEKQFILNWIESLTRVDCGATTPRDPGRVTIRRLNRAEYNNTIRDLCGVDFKPADDFPADDVGYGFDNIGDVLSFQPILLEKYLAAAEKILNTALVVREPVKPFTAAYRPGNPSLRTLPRDAKKEGPARIVFRTEGSAFIEKHEFPAEGEYIVRFRGWGTNVGGEYPRVAVRVAGREIQSFTVDAEPSKPRVYAARARLPGGGQRVSVAFLNEYENKAANQAREFGLDLLEIEGPFHPTLPPEPKSTQMLLIARPPVGATPEQVRAAAEKVLSHFATRAYRRPVRPEELDRLLKLFDVATAQGERFEEAIKLPMKAVLVSPHFLFRIEEDPANPDDVRTLNDFELATRLSYFLWSSMPDDELFGLAQRGELRRPGVLEAQVRRMFQDPKAKALAENFGGQWLQLGLLKPLSPDKALFPNWDESLKAAMAGEALAFFEYVMRNDRSILDFLDADYTFVNARLARHYGIPGVTGSEFQKVKLTDGRRGGVVTMASTLTLTSNPTRTSPVKRGKWILENILGVPPPPPAPDVPELPPVGQLKGTLRQQMEQHRANPSCAVCHAKLDPLGFGLENFDAIGAWRDRDNKQPIDASGELPGGEKFNGPAELRKVLLSKADQFRRCFAEKLLTFALGRGLEYYDKCAVDDIVSSGKAHNDAFSAYVLAVVKSDPFQKRKGKRTE